MLLIAHSGLVSPTSTDKENSIELLEGSMDEGFDVEIDIRYEHNELLLSHDDGRYVVDPQWLVRHRNKLWIRCKSLEALRYFHDTDFNYFWDQDL